MDDAVILMRMHCCVVHCAGPVLVFTIAHVVFIMNLCGADVPYVFGLLHRIGTIPK